MSGTALWAAVLGGAIGCYLLKLAGPSVPAAWVEQPWVARVVDFVPAALPAALAAVQAVGRGSPPVVPRRLAGLPAGAGPSAARGPVIVLRSADPLFPVP